jgi:hypothetical protein
MHVINKQSDESAKLCQQFASTISSVAQIVLNANSLHGPLHPPIEDIQKLFEHILAECNTITSFLKSGILIAKKDEVLTESLI